MESRDADDASDVHSLLAQKERDLILAAELGKALLEKNETLSRENEVMAENYSKNLEELAQEKHSLTMKMSVMESGYEAQMLQLQADLQNMRQEIENEHDSGRNAAKERSKVITELTEQNQRLTRQLRDAIKNEEQLNVKLQQMRSVQDARYSNISEHVSHLEVMRDEVTLLTEQRDDLEQRVRVLAEERSQLSSRLDETTDRLLCLERENRQQCSELRQNRLEMSDLHTTNSSLAERLDAVTSRGGSPGTARTSLMNELDVSADEGIGSGSHNLVLGVDQQSTLLSSTQSPTHTTSSPSQQLLINLDTDDVVECDNLLVPLTDSQQLRELRQEVVDVLLQLRALNERVRPDRANVNSMDTDSSEDLPLHKVKVGMLQEVFGELQSRVHDLLRPRKSACEACGRQTQLQLEIDAHAAEERSDQLEKKLTQLGDTVKRQAEELARYMQELVIKEKQYEALKEERDILKSDLSSTHLSKEALIKKAWETRDQAVQRKNATEVELAKSRIDVMQINSQLLESIRQKVELSCQLEQWQNDMQQLLEEQMRRKLTQTEVVSDSDSSTGTRSSQRQKKSILGIFSRS